MANTFGNIGATTQGFPIGPLTWTWKENSLGPHGQNGHTNIDEQIKVFILFLVN